MCQLTFPTICENLNKTTCVLSTTAGSVVFAFVLCALSDALKDIICKYELVFVLQLCSESQIQHKKGVKCYISCRSTAFLIN